MGFFLAFPSGSGFRLYLLFRSTSQKDNASIPNALVFKTNKIHYGKILYLKANAFAKAIFYFTPNAKSTSITSNKNIILAW